MKVLVVERSCFRELCFGKKWLMAMSLAWLMADLACGQVVINEFLAINRNTLFQGSETPAYVELYNTSGSAVNLRGWGVSDTATYAKYTFQSDVYLGAYGYLLLYLDSETNNPGIHVGFNTRDNGDDVVLFNSSGVIVDRLVFGMQVVDLAIGRIPNGTGPFKLNEPTPEDPNREYTNVVAASVGKLLKINEWLADPPSGGGGDWFELYNGEASVVDLNGAMWSNLTVTNPALPAFSLIGPRGFIQFFAEGTGAVADHYDEVNFKLPKSGGNITLLTSNRLVIDQINFGAQTTSITQGRLPDGTTNIVFLPKATPEAANFFPLTDIVINELLSHTDPPVEDAVEFYNPTGVATNIGGWWLSNSRDNPKKHRIPPGTVIPAFGYKVIYETNFLSPTNVAAFTFNSAHGDEVYLHSADAAGNLTGYRVGLSFPAAQNRVSFGRHVTSDGRGEFVPMTRTTFGVDNPTTVQNFRTGTGLSNAYPLVGPLVISEIMYHPPDIIIDVTNRVDNRTNEYLEIYNVSGRTIHLYDTNGPYNGLYYDPNYGYYADGRTNTWRIRGDVDFNFPTNVTLGPGRYLLVVNFDTTDAIRLNYFRSTFQVPTNVQVLGPYQGSLPNSKGNIELYKPDPPQGPNHPEDFAIRYVPYVLVEQIEYRDSTPWPTGSDGGGFALQRIKPEEFGNDPINWADAEPSPGKQLLKIDSARQVGNALVFGFTGLANGSYSVVYQTNLNPSGAWQKSVNLPLQANTGTRYVTNAITAGAPSRFYRVVSPALP